MIVLNKKFAHNDQDLEIFIKYDEVGKNPVEVKHIIMHTHGGCYPIGGLMTKYFKNGIWDLIKRTDWEAVKKEIEDTNWANLQASLNSLPKIIDAMSRPLIVTGGECKEILN